MAKENEIEQPGVEIQKLLKEIMDAEPTEFVFMGKKYKIGWLYNETISRFTKVFLNEKNEQKRNIKMCVLLTLNNRWKIKFQYWYKWRWIYYFKDFNDVESLAVIDACKKKIPLIASSLTTTLATGMTDVMMTMMKKEASAIQAVQHGAQGSR